MYLMDRLLEQVHVLLPPSKLDVLLPHNRFHVHNTQLNLWDKADLDTQESDTHNSLPDQ